MSEATPLQPDRRRLAKATAVAAATALVVLVVAVLPAEYGIDPTGIGRALGFAKLGDEPPQIIDTTGQGPQTVYAFDLAWQVREEVLLVEKRSYEAPGVEQRVDVDFQGTNLTRLTAELQWSGGDRFGLAIDAPHGRRGPNASGASGELETSVAGRDTPTPTRNATGAYAIDGTEDRSAQGTFTIRVRLLEAAANDAGDEWTLTVTARTYGITNLGSFGDAAADDRVSFTLEPGRSIEYKFQMDTGANLSYRWQSTADVTFDFHGDEPGKEDAPVSHKKGSAAADEGDFTAPFTGRHGWWFYNRGQEPLTITLVTRGDYTVLGVV